MKTNRPVFKIILIIWVIFSVLYVAYTQYKYFNVYVAQSAYQKGLSDAVAQVIQKAQGCKKFSVTLGGQDVQLLNADCNARQIAADNLDVERPTKK